MFDGQPLSRRRFGAVAFGGGAAVLMPGYAAGVWSAELAVARPVMARAAPADGLPRSTPEVQGVDSGAVLAFLEEVSRAGLELHSFMLMRHGHVVAEGWWWPYLPQRIHMTHSLTKSETSVGVGLAIDEGHFGLDDKVASFFPSEVPAGASDNLKAMTVRNLLTMQTGHDHETSGSAWRPIKTSWIAEFFKIPVTYQPGTKWVYTSAASYMLSAIVTRTTGKTLHGYLKPRMLEPMKMGPVQWDMGPNGINAGGNGLSWTLGDSIKLGALHEQKGVWNGHRILSENWVEAATRKQAIGEDYGYGYQWWMGPDSAYYGLGLFCQMTIVFPEHNAVLAIFSAIDESYRIKPRIWKHFPAAFGAPRAASPAATRLQSHTAGLRLLRPAVRSGSPNAARVSGKTYRIDGNDQSVSTISFGFAPDRCVYRMTDDRGTHSITSGLGEWLEQDTTMTGHRLHHEYQPDRMRVVAGARWLDDDTLEMTWTYVEAAFRDIVMCKFVGDRLIVDRSVNLNSKETKLPTLTGRFA